MEREQVTTYPVCLRLSNGDTKVIDYAVWRKFLFRQAMAMHDLRPLRISDKLRYRSEYLAFCNARLRCDNPKDENYGGRGIKFLFNSFAEFLEEIGPKPIGYVLDRINNNGNYEAGNVRWVTPTMSSRSTRKKKNSRDEKILLDTTPTRGTSIQQKGYQQ